MNILYYMEQKVINMEFEGKCHFCGGDVVITSTRCKKCGTSVKGDFNVCELCKLSAEAKVFIKVFIQCDGNIKNVEKSLGISYPTVKSRLALVKEELSRLDIDTGVDKSRVENKNKRQEILNKINNGELSVDEALSMLDNN